MRLSAVQNDRVAGVLVGTAAGDALGAGYEFTKPAADAVIDMIGGGTFNWAPGEWTDDTAMTIAVARALAGGADVETREGFDAVAAEFLRWYDTQPKDIGNQTRAVLAHRPSTANEMVWHAKQLGNAKQGNGSLMRTSAIALDYLDDARGCSDAAAAVSRLTHPAPEAVDACRIWSSAIRYAVLHGSFDGVRKAAAHTSDPGYWLRLLDQAENGRPEDFSNNGWVVHALQTAWWAITTADASSPRHLQDALELCVRAGSDTDTTAATAGGLLGARWGASAVPARWRRIMHGYPGMDANDLVRVAMRIAFDGGADERGWPLADTIDYAGFSTDRLAVHPHDEGVILSGAAHYDRAAVDAVISLCRVGAKPIAAEHIQFWLVDSGKDRNANIEFVLDDAARTINELRREGKRVLVHCVEGKSRTPAVAARYAKLLGRDPRDVLRVMPWARPNPALWNAATR
ncbi:ADP-ribosylglycohydrolase family protein [Aldersonia kunmingensis]|uniref:ADP-ribosylglycohydrolase family protein n=1 Tax=Aldersonia kunmingensis TaxID=408066 RepID=UPI00082DF37F|nr:ADP-ribosylglycohydrolase family protein [Aldersonia kunmingensis]